MTKNYPEKIILHHSGVDSSGNQLTAINRYHKSRGFPLSELGWYVGYHELIEKDGRIIKTRESYEEGAHTLNDWNRKSIGICLIGNFHVHAPTQAQLVALQGLIDKYNLPYIFHKDADERRTCAGRYLTRDLVESKREPDPILEIEKREELKKYLSLLQRLVAQLQKLLSLLVNK